MEIANRIPRCKHSTDLDLDLSLLMSLSKLETDLGYELDYTSGFRCAVCNLKAGGVKQSAHLKGKAVDIRAHESRERFKILSAALALGFRRAGVGKNIIHLDVDDSLDQDVIWIY